MLSYKDNTELKKNKEIIWRLKAYTYLCNIKMISK